MTRVLIIDDDENLAELVGALVARAGYEPVVVNSLLDAVRAVHAGDKIDVILSDYFLGETDGLAVIDMLRQYQPGLPAIVATSNASSDLTEAARLRDVAHIVKPFLVSDLATAIENALAVGGTKQGGNI